MVRITNHPNMTVAADMEADMGRNTLKSNALN